MVAAKEVKALEPLVFPPDPDCIAIDTREQLPYSFAGLFADTYHDRHGRRRPIVPRIVRTCIPTGDYSLFGHEERIAIERKSLNDLFNTLGQGRSRFGRELQRLAALDYAAVVVEADWQRILADPPPRSHLNPKTVYRSVIAWQQRYPKIHWWTCWNREFAEVTVFRILERYWRDQQQRKQVTRNGP